MAGRYIGSMEWEITPGLTPYDTALQRMQAHVAAMRRGEAGELVWLVEHPPTYTAGTSARPDDLLQSSFPVFTTGRGGQYTYHGPGQRVVYLMLDLNKRGRDVRAYVQALEQWIIATLAQFGVQGFIREGRVGVWVEQGSGIGDRGSENVLLTADARLPTPEKKIAALGVRVQGWVSSHGIAINVNPDLSHYAGIVPCGIREHGVTSLAALGVDASMDAVDAALKESFALVFK